MAQSAKQSIIRKTIEFGASTMMSRVLGIAREVLQVRLLGLGVASDAFIAAYRIPNFLRKIFAEGALTGAFVPTIVSIVKRDGKASANDLMTLSFIVFEGTLLALCLLVLWKPYAVIRVVVLGFSAEQVAYAVPFLRILILFILFISSSALLGGALQAVHHFFIPAFAPVILNIFYLAGLLGCLWYGWSLNVLCVFIVAGSAASFLMHLLVYFKYHFSFGAINAQAWRNFQTLVRKFIPSLFGMSVVEINLFLGSIIASFLSNGTYSLLYYGSRLLNIPLGVFAVAFASILLPHFTKVGMYAPKRLSFYLLETAKFILWVTLPAGILMALFADKIYITLFVSSKFPIERVPEAAHIFIAFLAGLFFFSVNKILLNLYYSMHDMRVPTITSAISTVVDVSFSLLLIKFFGAMGIAFATTLMGATQTVLLLYFLRKKYHFNLYGSYFVDFLWRYICQLVCILPLFYGVYWMISSAIASVNGSFANFLLNKVGFWLWMLPLMVGTAVVLYVTRRWFGLRAHFLD